MAWAAIIPAVIGAISAMSSASSSGRSSATQGAQDLLAKQQAAAGGRPPYQPTATRVASATPGAMQANQGGLRLQDIVQENQQNQMRLDALKQGRSVGQMMSAGAPPAAATNNLAGPPGQAPAAVPPYMAGRQSDPTGQYSMSSVPQTQTNPGMSTDQKLALAQGAAAIGSSLYNNASQAPPSAGIPNTGPAYGQPTALAQLQALIAARQGRRF